MVELNSQQLQAASHTDGPLQIIAGPGSGKTLVLTEKVKNLVMSGIPPQSILCMTFTEKAAGEMKQRLKKSGILDAKVSTFHSFAKEILEDNFMESGLNRDAKIFRKTSQMVWCIKNTDRFDFNQDYLNIGNNQIQTYTLVLRAIGFFKKERIKPDELEKYIQASMAKLEHSDQDDAKIKKQSKSLHRLYEFNKVYTEYEKYREGKGLIDFDDMVTKAIEILEKDEVLLQEYLDRFKYILVDEFQDNNFSQLSLVKILGKEGNVTVVGDGDQCIMRFQGAFFGIFKDFQKSFPNFKKIDISRNYRSTKNITDLAIQILNPIQNRELKTLFSEEKDGMPVQVVTTHTDKGQIEFVAKTIQDMLGKPLERKDGVTSPIAYKDIAILSRRNAEGQKFTNALRSFGIPATFVGETDIFANRAILDLVAFLKIAASSATSGVEVYRLLKSHGIHEQNIAVLTNAAHKKARHVYGEEHDFVLYTVRQHMDFRITQKSEIAELIEQIDNVIRIAGHLTTSELVYKIIFEISGIYKKSINSEKPFDRKNILLLNKFYEIAQEFQDINPASSVSDFIEHLSIIGNFEIEVEDFTPEDTVNVLTMHKSKGKEFPIVFVTDLADGRFPGSWKESVFTIPVELMKGAGRTADSKVLHTDEERRLFYVAATRTMDVLYLLYPKRYAGNVNEKQPSQFLCELNYEDNPLIETVEFDESENFNIESEDAVQRKKESLQREAASAISQQHLTTAMHRIVELSRIKHYERHESLDGFDPATILKIDVDELDLSSEIVRKRQPLINTEEFSLSASSIKAYNDCPLKFKFQKILRVPQPHSASLDLGTVIHSMTEEMANEKAKGKKITLDVALEKLKEKWIFHSYKNQTDETKAMGRAERMIDTYLKWEEAAQNTLVDTELSFEVSIANVVFTGRIDRLEKNPEGRFEVVDFKSGSSSKSKKDAVVDPQLNIYAKAVEELKGELPAKATLFYVEKDKTVEYQVTAESVREAMTSIGKTVENILKESFQPTPSFQACMFCPYQSICDAKIVKG